MGDVLRRVSVKLLILFLITALSLPVDDFGSRSLCVDPGSDNFRLLVLFERPGLA